jgi:ATP-dependent helicase/nuclease subunit B
MPVLDLKEQNHTTLKEIYKNIDNHILLTSSQILTNHYKNKLNSMAGKSGSTFWHNMPVFQLNLWAKDLYMSLDNRNAVSSQTHKIMLAYRIIRNLNSESSTKSTMQMARKVITTFNHCQKWRLPYTAIRLTQITNNHSIQEVVKTLANELQAQNLIDETGIIAAISSAIAARIIKVKKTLVLVGFEYLDPTTLDLIKTLSRCTNISQLSNLQDQNQTRWLQSKQTKSAYYDFAAWHKTLPQHATVGFLTPNPNDAETIRHIALALNTNHIANKQHNIYHIKSNQSILSFDIIKSALLLMKLTTTNIKTTSIIQILLSSHLFSTSIAEKIELAHPLEKKLHSCEEYISIANILKIIESLHPAFISDTATNLIQAIEFIAAKKNSTKLQEHINNFKQILTFAKWPILQNKHEQKIAAELANLLTNIANFSNNNISISSDEAYDIIADMIENHKILLDNNSAPIQICDIMTGSFLCYDYIWVANLNDCSWPRYSSAKTFINQHIMENQIYSKANQINMAENAISRIARGSLACVYNYASICDNIAASPTYMIQNIIANNEQLNLTNTTQHDYNEFCKSNIVEKRLLEHTVPLSQQEHSINTYTIRDFNTCHFKSFAKFRLFAKELTPPSLGLRAVEKGIIVHNILQEIYTNITFLHELKDMEPDKMAGQIYTIALKNINKILEYKPNSASDEFIKSECQKITTNILTWIQHDLTRENCQIHATEQEIKIKINDITIKGIIDRVDKLASNKYMIIDYKTGSANINSWFTNTISEPQMPIYSIAYTNNLAATCYAHINNNNIGFSGITDNTCIIPELKTTKNTPAESINDIVIIWRNTIEQTLTTYTTGSIKTIAGNTNTECNKCPYSGICRIWEKNTEHN